MFWRIEIENDAVAEETRCADGRFVLHRHRDEDGPHLDLRLEEGDCLLGWRIDGAALAGTCWATEKAAHPLRWLDEDGDAVREDAGTYVWQERSARGGVLVLRGRDGVTRRLGVQREANLSARAAHGILVALEACGAGAADAAGLIADGEAARRRAVGRLCGLARELDGSAFDEAVMRKTLHGLTLDEVHAQLRAYEVRFDEKYPPQPVSRPERLCDEAETHRADAALAILRDA